MNRFGFNSFVDDLVIKSPRSMQFVANPNKKPETELEPKRYPDVCMCYREPYGADGVEGYCREDLYKYSPATTKDGKEAYRVWFPDTSGGYTFMTKRVFNKYFKPIGVK